MRRIIVTGGTSGIGLGVVERLLKTTDDNVISVSKNIDKIKAVRNKLNKFHSRIEFYSVDVTDEDAVSEFAKTIGEKYGAIDGLVNSAGIIAPGGIEECSISAWKNVLSCNVDGMFIMTKALLPLLKQSKEPASIVNISSVNSIRCGSSIAYSTSKAATDMFTKGLALELAKYQIRANSVNPGVVISELQKSAGICISEDEYQAFIERMTACHPLGRVGVPDDIAGAVLFLLSKDAKWITGAILSVDGGRAI